MEKTNVGLYKQNKGVQQLISRKINIDNNNASWSIIGELFHHFKITFYIALHHVIFYRNALSL